LGFIYQTKARFRASEVIFVAVVHSGDVYFCAGVREVVHIVLAAPFWFTVIGRCLKYTPEMRPDDLFQTLDRWRCKPYRELREFARIFTGKDTKKERFSETSAAIQKIF